LIYRKQNKIKRVRDCFISCENDNKNILPAVVHFLFYRIGQFLQQHNVGIEGFYPNIGTPGRCY
jgi:hypothetical protein